MIDDEFSVFEILFAVSFLVVGAVLAGVTVMRRKRNRLDDSWEMNKRNQ